jgi:uncharacterized protein (UPF0371 family)
MYTKEQCKHYNINRDKACGELGITQNQYNWLRRKGEDLRKIYENNCNGLYLDDETYTQICQVREDEIYAYLIKHKLNTKEYKIYVHFQTDPRGATLFLSRQPIPENNYTNAYCIY